MAKASQFAYFQQFMGTETSTPSTFGLMPNSKSPGQLSLMCSDEYGLISSCDPSGTRNQTYDGFRDFSIQNQQNFLLKRDLDPASNDNDPMWLERAA